MCRCRARIGEPRAHCRVAADAAGGHRVESARGRTLRASVEAVTDRPLTAVVVTHWHYDHTFGLAAFADVSRIAHESVHSRLLSAEAVAEAQRLGVDLHELGQPNVEIAVAALDLGDRRVEIAHLGRGHTDGDLVVVVPDADALFCRDLWNQPDRRRLVPTRFLMVALDAVIGLMTATHRGSTTASRWAGSSSSNSAAGLRHKQLRCERRRGQRSRWSEK